MSIIQTLKQKKIYIILGLAILLSVFCIIRMILPKQEYHFYNEYYFVEGTVRQEAVIYEEIALPPGVYDVILEYNTSTSMKNLCYLEDSTVYTGGLLTNGENLHKNLKNTDFRMWLFEGTESLKLKVLYGGEGTLVTGNLTIRETNTLWTMVLTLIWSAVIVLCAIFAFAKYDKVVGVDKEKKSIFWGLILIVFVASIPYMQNANMVGGDLAYHLMRIEGVKDGLKSGQFPLRIEPEWLFNHGYANAIFYCSTFLYFPAILRLLGFTVMTSYNLYCILANIATVFISYYCFSRIFKKKYIGLLCSALYSLSIVRIYKMVFIAAVGEFSAITFMPLVVYGLYRVFTEDVKSSDYQRIWIPIAIGYAGLLQTHVLSCEITAFLTIITCVIMIKKVFVKETFIVLAKGALAAICVSLWYLVPFLDFYMNEDLTIHHVSARTIQERGLYPAQLFFHWWEFGDEVFTNQEGMAQSHPMGVGLVLGIAFFLFLILRFSGKINERNNLVGLTRISWAFAGLLMLFSLGSFPWDAIQNLSSITAPLISSIQFPNRFLSWGTVFLVIICGSLLCYFQEKCDKWYFYISVIVVLVSISTSSMYLIDYICRDKEYLYIYNEEGVGFGYISGSEYLLNGTKQELLDYDVPVGSENVEVITYDADYLEFQLSCVNYGKNDGYIEVPLLHYTGYRAYATDTGIGLETEKGTNNLVRVILPEGFNGAVQVKFVSPIYWRLSEVATYAWWLGLGVLLLKKYLKNKEERK